MILCCAYAISLRVKTRGGTKTSVDGGVGRRLYPVSTD